MAFSVVYRGEFKDLLDNDWRIDIEEDGFVGAITTMQLTGNPLMLSWAKKDDFKFQPLRTSQCEVNVWVEDGDDFIYRNLITSDEEQFRVKVYKNTTNLHWQGFFIPDTYDEDFEDTPYVVTFKFTDGLGRLQNIDYADAYDVPFTGKTDVLSIILNCLDKLSNTFDIIENVNIYDDTMANAATDSPLTQTFLNQDRWTKRVKKNDILTFESTSCFEVLEDVLKIFGARMHLQAQPTTSPAWYISQVNELGGGASFNVRGYDSLGVFTGNTPNTNYIEEVSLPSADDLTKILFLRADHGLEWEPVFGSFLLTFDPGELTFPDIITDGTIDEWDDASTPTHWAGTAVSNNKVSRIPIQLPDNVFYPRLTFDSVNDNFIQSKIAALIQNGNDIELTFSFYQFMDVSGVDLSAIRIYFHETGSPVRIAVINNGQFLNYTTQDNHSWQNARVINSFIWDGISGPGLGFFHTITMRFTLQADGDFFIRLYQADIKATISGITASGAVQTVQGIPIDIGYDLVSAKLIDTGNSGAQLVTLNTKLVNNSTIDEKEIKLKFGDLSNGLNTGTIELSNGALTDTWFTKGNAENLELIQLLNNLIIMNFDKPTRLLDGTFWGGQLLQPNKTIHIDEDGTDIYYTANQLEYNVKEVEWSGQWFENVGNTLAAQAPVRRQKDLPVGPFDQFGAGGASFSGITLDSGPVSGDISFNASQGDTQQLLITDDTTLNTVDNSLPMIVIEVQQDEIGGHAFNLGDKLHEKFVGQLAVDQGASKKTVLEFIRSPSAAYVLVNQLTDTIGDEIFFEKKTITSAQILTGNTAPVELVPTPGAGKGIEIIEVTARLNFGTAAYATNTDIVIVNTLIVASFSHQVLGILAAVNDTFVLFGRRDAAVNLLQVVENEAIEFAVKGGNPTVGDGTLDIWVFYKLINL